MLDWPSIPSETTAAWVNKDTLLWMGYSMKEAGMLPALLKEGRGLAALKDKPAKGENSQRQSFVQGSQTGLHLDACWGGGKRPAASREQVLCWKGGIPLSPAPGGPPGSPLQVSLPGCREQEGRQDLCWSVVAASS